MSTRGQTELLRNPWTVDQIRRLEREGLSVGLPLMQRAADCALAFLLRERPAAQRFLVLAGPGNNGGDALTMALGLLDLGHSVTVIAPATPEARAVDAQHALARWKGMGQIIHTAWPADLERVDVIVDGLFGIGLSRPLKSPWADLVRRANEHASPILALDVPSGLHAESGQTLGSMAIRAQWTVSFIAPTLGVCSTQARPWVGQQYVCTLDLR